MAKSAQAFRSIGEVAKLIGVAPHVLRYWETQLPQLSPVKRADGRRYYRPEDVELAAGLCAVMREDGMTARGAAKLMAQDKGAALRARGAARLAELMGDEAVPAPRPTRTRAARSAAADEARAAGVETDAAPPFDDATAAQPGERVAAEALPPLSTALPQLPDIAAAPVAASAGEPSGATAADDVLDSPTVDSAEIAPPLAAAESPSDHRPSVVADDRAEPAAFEARPIPAPAPASPGGPAAPADLLLRMARVAAALPHLPQALRPELRPVAERLRMLLAS